MTIETYPAQVEKLAEGLCEVELGCVIGDFVGDDGWVNGRGCVADHKKQAALLLVTLSEHVHD